MIEVPVSCFIESSNGVFSISVNIFPLEYSCLFKYPSLLTETERRSERALTTEAPTP